MTGLFGGVDLGTPATRNEHALKRELELRRKREPASGFGKVYRNGADLMLTHGEFYPGQLLPEQYHHLAGPLGQCYWNCAAAAEADPTLRYCEGIVASGGGRFLSHAWCLAPDDGVLDLTWVDAVGHTDAQTHLPILPHEHWGYFGVIFQPELVRAHEEMPMLGRDIAAESIRGVRQQEDGRWFSPSGLELTPPTTLPLLDVKYDRARTTLP